MFVRARIRLTLWYVAALAVILLSAGMATYFTLARAFRHESDDALRARLQEEVRFLTARDFEPPAPALQPPGDRDGDRKREDEDGHEDDEDEEDGGEEGRRYEPGTADILVYMLDVNRRLVLSPQSPAPGGLPAAGPLSEAASADEERLQDYNAGRHDFRLLSTPVYQEGRLLGYMQLAKSEEQHQQELAMLRIVMLVVGGGGLLLAGAGGYALAGRTLAPIRRAMQRQRDFVADASHELRTPLTVLRANIEVAARPGTADSEELLADSLSEVDHMSRLVDDLLTIARIDSGALRVAGDPVDIASLAREVCRGMERVAEAGGRRIECDASGTVIVAGDTTRLRQLLAILVDNAIRYNREGGSVRVSVAAEGDRAAVTVTDTGIGIAAADLARITERFYRVDQARSSRGGGTGLGLAIAAWIVEAHRGRMRFESAVGNGTTVRMTLPIARG